MSQALNKNMRECIVDSKIQSDAKHSEYRPSTVTLVNNTQSITRAQSNGNLNQLRTANSY